MFLLRGRQFVYIVVFLAEGCSVLLLLSSSSFFFEAKRKSTEINIFGAFRKHRVFDALPPRLANIQGVAFRVPGVVVKVEKSSDRAKTWDCCQFS